MHESYFLLCPSLNIASQNTCGIKVERVTDNNGRPPKSINNIYATFFYKKTTLLFRLYILGLILKYVHVDRGGEGVM